ncbi:MAG: hypothetical protein Q8M23_03055 [Bacteroidales bacterium]|nr:hypothetical protein [Bacteroidales bacterium]
MARYLILLLILFLSIVFNNTKAQGIYSSYNNQFHDLNLKAGDWIMGIHNNNFLKNNEYFGPYTKGITFIGSIFQPHVAWAMNDKLQIEGGWFFRKFFGQEGFDASQPVFTVQYKFIPGARFIVGQIRGQLHHKYIEPVYNTDNYFVKKPAYGLQLLYDKNRLKSDLWLNWEKFIMPGSNHPEVINAGWLFSYKLHRQQSPNDIVMEMQSVIHHQGGQIDRNPLPLITRANVAGGFKYNITPGSNLLKNIYLRGFYIQSFEWSHTNILPFDRGFGVYTDIVATNPWITLGVGFFHGQYFFAPMGDYLFQSISDTKPWFIEEKRNLLTNKLMIQRQAFGWLQFGLRFESYFDVVQNRFEYTYGFNLSLNPLLTKGSFKVKNDLYK